MEDSATAKVTYPIGQQDFKLIRENRSVYVDKTMYIQRILDSHLQYFFLARPRRFGKSLFLSTLRYFFEGDRDLFKGLSIDSADWKWEEYPVLSLDLNTDRYADQGKLDFVTDSLFKEWEKKYGVEEKSEDFSQRFRSIIAAAHQMTGKRVVILVDEYDKPLVGNLNKPVNFEHYRAKLASLYSNFKSSAEHIKLVFLTGVSRFSKLSVFSDLNNINDITFSNAYADICGITEKELLENFEPGIRKLAFENGLTFENACKLLKRSYDGYKFAKQGSDIYNPWSLLKAMSESQIGNYWNHTGKPTIIAEALKHADVDLEKILNTRCTIDQLGGLDLTNASPLALLYQTGYLTIKKYNSSTDRVTLGVPNKEVRQGLFNELLPYYINVRQGTPAIVMNDIINSILDGEPKEFINNLNIFLAGIPYEMKMENENNLHNAIYILLTLIGVHTETEVHTSDGRIDLLIKTPDFIYIIELKFDRHVSTALNQIQEKAYDISFKKDGRRIFKIGVNFSTSTRRLDAPLITEE